MSSLAPEQLAAAQKVDVETLFGVSSKAVDAIEKLVALNLGVAESALAENNEIVSKALSAKDLQDLSALLVSYSQPATDKVRQYGREVYEIVRSMQSEFGAAAESLLQHYCQETEEFVDRLAKDAQAGSESAVAAWKAFVKTTSGTISATYEAARKATKQVLKIAENNVSAVSAVSTAKARRTRQAVESVDAVES